MQTKTARKVPAMKLIAKKTEKFEGKSLKSGFLYIGCDTLLKQYLLKIFKDGMMASSFDHALNMIAYNSRQIAYDIIFIDIAFDSDKLKGFVSFLGRNSNLTAAIFVYNISKVRYSFDAIKQLQIIDDVVDLKSDPAFLDERMDFLKRAKQKNQTQSKSIKREIASESNRFNSTYIAKRIIDLFVSIVTLIILSPLFLLIAIIIKLETKGPIIYTSSRAGKGFKVFKFYKFRTMEMNADRKIEALAHLNQYDVNSNGPRFFKLNNDPRITTFGKFLRNTSLDELPQLINVILGDMSLVGNRPLPLYEAATLTTNEYIERFMAPSGITGLWQIKKRGKPQMSTQERVALDVTYAKNFNLIYDMWIIYKTPAALFQKSSV